MLNFLFKPHRSIFKANTTEAQKVFFLLQLIPQPEIEQVYKHSQDVTLSQFKSAASFFTRELITDLQAEVSVVKGVILERITQVYPSISEINLTGKSYDLGNIATEDPTKFIFELTLSNFKRPPSRVRIAQVRFTSQHEKFPEQNLFVDFTTVEDIDNLPFLRLHRIKIYIHLGEYDKAQSLVEQEKSEYLRAINNSPNAEVEHFDIRTLLKLEKRLAEIKQLATNLDSDLPSKSEIIKQSRESMLDDVSVVLQNTPYKEVFQKHESSLREQAQESIENTQEWQLDSIRSYNTLADFLLGKLNPELSNVLESGSTEDLIATYQKLKHGKDRHNFNEINLPKDNLNKLEVERHILNATSIFLEPDKGNDSAYIKNSLTILTQAKDWAKNNNFLDIENDALWGIYLCYNRLEQYPEAVETLQALRNHIELLRERISNPHEGAGLISKFPYLFPSLCQLLVRLNRPTELLQAIEGAKGRVLADVLTEQHTQPVSEKSFAQDVEQLPELMRQVKAHYLTYLVDDEQTYAVLVDKHGSTHINTVSIGKNQLQDLLENDLGKNIEREEYNPINPKNWKKKERKTRC